MIDVAHVVAEVLASPWLLPLLTVAVIADGAFPFLPSEPILFSATGTAAAAGDVGRVLGLFGAALLGSLLGDGLLYGAGRSSHRLLRTARKDDGIGAWVRRHLHRRPILALLAVRVVPGGRLVSVTAAGRVHLPLRRFACATGASSLFWATYMTGIGLALGPVTGGQPLWSLLAGLASAALISGVVTVGRRLWRARRRWAVASPGP